MDTATIIAICTGVTGVIGAVTALIAQLRHNANTSAHQPPSPGQ